MPKQRAVPRTAAAATYSHWRPERQDMLEEDSDIATVKIGPCTNHHIKDTENESKDITIRGKYGVADAHHGSYCEDYCLPQAFIGRAGLEDVHIEHRREHSNQDERVEPKIESVSFFHNLNVP